MVVVLFEGFGGDAVGSMKTVLVSVLFPVVWKPACEKKEEQ
jgi:hypothetical protein